MAFQVVDTVFVSNPANSIRDKNYSLPISSHMRSLCFTAVKSRKAFRASKSWLGEVCINC